MCTGMEVLATAAIVSAVGGTTVGAMNYVQSSEAADAAKGLADQQKAQLKSEQDAAAAQAAAQAGTGQTFEFSNGSDALRTGFGFGGGGGSSANSGRGQVTGMS